MAANDMFDVGPVMQGGSGAVNPGSAAYYGFQRELMRRQQQQMAAEAIQRQQAQDALDAEMKRAALANTTESTKSLVEQRKAAAAKDALAAAIAPLAPGQTLTPEQSTALKSSGGGGFVFAKPATPALEAGGPIENLAPPLTPGGTSPDVAATPAVEATPASETFIGTAAQQESERQKKVRESVLSGKSEWFNKLDPETQNAIRVEFGWNEMGGKGSLPASVVRPPKTPQDTKAARELEMQDYRAKVAQGYKPTLAEREAYNSWHLDNPTSLDIEESRNRAAAAASERSDQRLERQQTFQTKQQFRTAMVAEDKELQKDLERVDRATYILHNSKNFVGDAVVAPEFLQIVAGGMGSGLRMTDAELRRVNEAQSRFDQLKGYVAKFGIGADVTIQDKMRAEISTILDTVQQARERKAKLMEDTLAGLDTATTPGEVDKLHAAYWGKRREANNLSTAGGAKPTAADLIKKYGGK